MYIIVARAEHTMNLSAIIALKARQNTKSFGNGTLAKNQERLVLSVMQSGSGR
jgi:hypothetical protein